MIELCIVTLTALALSRAGRPAEYGVGLDVAPRTLRQLYRDQGGPWAEAIEAQGEYLDGKRSYDEVPTPGSRRGAPMCPACHRAMPWIEYERLWWCCGNGVTDQEREARRGR